MKRNKINYDELTVTFNGTPSKESLKNYYNLLIDHQIRLYGKKIVKKALEELLNDTKDK